MEVTAFSKRQKLRPKLRLKSILLVYKNRLEIKSFILGAIKELKLMIMFEKMKFKLHSIDCLKISTLSVGH